MGSYCELYIADYPVFSSKSYADPAVMTLFRESDKAVYERKVGDRNPVEWGHIEGGEELETVVEYRAQVEHVKQRLNIMGFTLNRVQREFENSKSAEVDMLREFGGYNNPKIISGLWEKKIALLESSTIEDYLRAFRTILESKVHPLYYLKRFPKSSKLVKHILNEHEEFCWSFPCTDARCFFRALVEIADEGSFVVQDLTEVVNAGYYDKDDEVCSLALQELIGDYSINSKIIVLTEGTTDKEVLEASLKLLYPHLYEYYSFMDFGMRPPGGVGPLVNAVKSFAAAGIENRVIALFDNDTAAVSAVKSLKGISIPKNIVIRHYPDIELARNYPTLGPNGLIHQDINGLACSIEIYFGEDVLKSDGSLTPIQWKNHDERLDQYHGEIMHKSRLKELFMEKLGNSQRDPRTIDRKSWSGINSIMLRIFDAFEP